jgi:integrase
MNELVLTQNSRLPVGGQSTILAIGQAANVVAAANLLADYQATKPYNTLRRQRAELARFSDYLADVGITVNPAWLFSNPAAWQGLAWGLISGFLQWQLKRGYAIGTINVTLATLKTYARLATQAGIIPAGEFTQIQNVKGFDRTEGRRVDDKRSQAGLATRHSPKKRQPVELATEQIDSLLNQPDTPQGRRDALAIALMAHLGLRVGELAGLSVGDINLKKATLTFYRQKVDKVQTHRLNGALPYAVAYLLNDALPAGPLFRGSNKSGQLTVGGWASQNINRRVKVLGEAIGLANLSPHDLRHSWASRAAAAGTPIDKLQEAGGWSNPVTPLTRYIKPAKIANEGVRLD